MSACRVWLWLAAPVAGDDAGRPRRPPAAPRRAGPRLAHSTYDSRPCERANASIIRSAAAFACLRTSPWPSARRSLRTRHGSAARFTGAYALPVHASKSRGRCLQNTRVLPSRACGTPNDAQFAPPETRTESPACCAPDAGIPIGGAQSGSLHAHTAGRDGTRASGWTSSGRRHCRCGVAQTAG
jgi:hypothetical protein